jgi:hypothetical protein
MARKKQPSVFVNLVFNIILPTLILEKGEKIFGPGNTIYALALGLFIPLAYAAWDYLKHRHKNYISILGAVNVLGTGGFALLELDGIWFAVKEAFFPLILGLGVIISEYFKKPFFTTFLRDSQAFNWALIEAKVKESGNTRSWHQLLKNSNRLFALSFFISAALNFLLARSIFKPLPLELLDDERTHLLNTQIAEMNWKGYVVIALPLLIFMMLVFWQLLRGIYKITGLTADAVTHQSSDSESSLKS